MFYLLTGHKCKNKNANHSYGFELIKKIDLIIDTSNNKIYKSNFYLDKIDSYDINSKSIL